MSLSSTKIYLLREFVDFICESCHKEETECGKLTPHRLQRGNLGGKYILRNILMLCSNCHKGVHAIELGIGGL